MVSSVLNWFGLGTTTRIGIVGMPPDADGLFAACARQVSRHYRCGIKVVRLGGKNRNHVDGRLIVNGASAHPGRCSVEIDVTLTGNARTDMGEITRAIIQILEELA